MWARIVFERGALRQHKGMSVKIMNQSSEEGSELGADDKRWPGIKACSQRRGWAVERTPTSVPTTGKNVTAMQEPVPLWGVTRRPLWCVVAL